MLAEGLVQDSINQLQALSREVEAMAAEDKYLAVSVCLQLGVLLRLQGMWEDVASVSESE